MKIASTNSSRNYEVIGKVEASTELQVKDVVTKARAAQPKWTAPSDTDLVFYEICDPPYQDGRFEDLPE